MCENEIECKCQWLYKCDSWVETADLKAKAITAISSFVRLSDKTLLCSCLSRELSGHLCEILCFQTESHGMPHTQILLAEVSA